MPENTLTLQGRELFEAELAGRRQRVMRYLLEGPHPQRFAPTHLQEAALSYVRRGGKALRAMVLLLSCGSMGGNEEKALPAAAAVEIYHLWTLVHDDIIDRDDLRRGGQTVHYEFSRRASEELGYLGEEARHYGLTLAILAGDLQQAWAVSLLSELHPRSNVDPALVLALIREMEGQVTPTLLEGETLDFRYAAFPFSRLNQELILDMLWKKTANLYEFCGWAGALLGLGRLEPKNPQVCSLATFTGKCGLAFQLQDDLLGAVGDQNKLGKPVGSDIREGKKTLIAYHAFSRADEEKRRKLERAFGNRQATAEEVEAVVRCFWDSGAIDDTRSLAGSYLREALEALETLPSSAQKDLLALWADFMLSREL